MRSELATDSQPDEFYAALASLEGAPIDAVEAAAAVLVEKAALGRRPLRHEYTSVAEEYGISTSEIQDWLRVLIVVAHYMTPPHEDTVDAIVSDLVEMGKVISGVEFKQRLKAMDSKFLEAHRAISNSLSAVRFTFPVLDHFHTRSSKVYTTEPRIDRWKHSPDTYKPRVASEVPVTLVQLDVSVFGDVKTVNFALTKEQMDEIINHLKLAKVELESVDRYVRREK